MVRQIVIRKCYFIIFILFLINSHKSFSQEVSTIKSMVLPGKICGDSCVFRIVIDRITWNHNRRIKAIIRNHYLGTVQLVTQGSSFDSSNVDYRYRLEIVSRQFLRNIGEVGGPQSTIYNVKFKFTDVVTKNEFYFSGEDEYGALKLLKEILYKLEQNRQGGKDDNILVEVLKNKQGDSLNISSVVKVRFNGDGTIKKIKYRYTEGATFNLERIIKNDHKKEILALANPMAEVRTNELTKKNLVKSSGINWYTFELTVPLSIPWKSI